MYMDETLIKNIYIILNYYRNVNDDLLIDEDFN